MVMVSVHLKVWRVSTGNVNTLLCDRMATGRRINIELTLIQRCIVDSMLFNVTDNSNQG